MPNWCMTDVRISGTDKDKFYEFMQEAKETARLKTDFGTSWLGHPLLLAGMPENDVIHGSVRCRGRIDNIYPTKDGDIYQCESAWSPCNDVFEYIKEKKKFDVMIDYYAEEPGCELYETTDYELSEGKYHIESEHSVEDKEWENVPWTANVTEDELKEILTPLFGEGSLQELIKKANEYEDEQGERYISINEIELV